MSKEVLKKMKSVAKEKKLKFAANANEKQMKAILDKAKVPYEHLYAITDPDGSIPSNNKMEKDKQEESKIEGQKKGKFYLGDCVKTGKPLYKNLK